MKQRTFLLMLFLSLWGLFVTTSALAQDNVVITENARKHFKAGVAYIEDPSGPKYEEAYREFHIAFAESPTYRILTNIGLCALNLERDEEAIESYERFLAKATPADIPKNKRDLMERDIAMLKASLVKVSITSVPARISLIDERVPSKGPLVINRYTVEGGAQSLGIHPGHHRITATADGYEPLTWEFEANSASGNTHAFNLHPIGVAATTTGVKSSTKTDNVPTEFGNHGTPTGVYISAIATGLFATSAVVTGLIATSKRDDYEKLNATGDNVNRARDFRNSGKTFALLTDVGIGAAVLSAGATAYFYFIRPSRKAETQLAIARWYLEPTVGNSQAGLSISREF